MKHRESFTFLPAFFSILFLFFAFESLYGQYQTIDATRTYYFETSQTNMSPYGQLENLCPGNKCGLGIKVDSVINHPNSTTNNFKELVRPAPAFGQLCPGDSWLGPKNIVDSNGDEYYFNGNGDTILIKSRAAVGSEWVLFDDGANLKFKATVDNIVYSTTALVSDSIKEISINRIDPSGNPLPHDFNNKQIKIGKTFGFVEVFDFFHFPVDTSLKTVMGATNPSIGYQDLTADKIFNYPIGGEFHYKEWQSSNFDFTSLEQSIRKIILNKIVSSNLDTITYTVDYTYFREEYGGIQNPVFSYSSGRDTIQATVILSINAIFDLLPFEITIPSYSYLNHSMLIYDESDPQWMKTVDHNYYSAHSGDSCLTELIATDFYGSNYKECLGQTNYYTLGGNWGNNVRNDSLVYYKKGNSTWGDSIDFRVLLSTKEFYQPSGQPVQLYPNPTSDILYVKDFPSTKELQVQIFDLQGRMLSNQTINADTGIDVGPLYEGLYYVSIMTVNQHYSSSFFKVD